MVLEKHVIIYECSLCQRTYSERGDAEKCEVRCTKLSGFPLGVLTLTPRTYNLLKIAGIDTVEEVLGQTDAYLLKLKGFGQFCLDDLHQQLVVFEGQSEHLRNHTRDPFIDIESKWQARMQASSNSASLPVSHEKINQAFELPELLELQVIQFVANQDWRALYKAYQWHNDSWGDGFPDILRLETQMRASVQKGAITSKDISDVACWAKYPSYSNIRSPQFIPLTEDSSLLPAIISLEKKVKRLGSTYLSKVLRFSFPNRAGALDSRLVRVFGMGDPDVNQYQWLTLRARKSGSGWSVYRDRTWHGEYEKWLNILTKMATLLNEQGIICPHPQAFIEAGLRTGGLWGCADVEMALYAYVTKVIR